MARNLLLLAALFIIHCTILEAASLSTPVLLSPTNGAVNTVTGLSLDWGNVTGAGSYRVFVHESKSVLQAITATQTTCTGCRVNALTSTSLFTFSYSDPLAANRQYYWMVRAGSSSGGSLNSSIWSFKTGDKPILVTYDSGGLGFDYFLVKIRLDAGARIEPYQGTQQGSGNINCLGAGYNYFPYTANTVKGFINTRSDIASARVVLSGSFHDGSSIETSLRPSFPQKIRGTIATFGKDCVTNYQGNLRMLEIRHSEGRAFIEPFDLTKFKSATIAPTVITGLHPDYDKNALVPLGRNFACVKDASGGGYKTVIFIVTDRMTSSTAKSILQSQGCDSSLMIQFDGSTVAQLSEKVGTSWQDWITLSGNMPQVFAIFDPQ